MNFSIDDHLVLKVVCGSHAYGTAVRGSDVDLRGVIVPPEEYFYGLRNFEQFAPSEGGDICYYDVRKFFRLAMQGNPSVLEIFHAPRLKLMIPFGKMILDMWRQVISKKVVRSHVGMAHAHLSRLDAQNRKCGAAGKSLIDEHGYNTKDAAHVVRVLSQCLEILSKGFLTLPRPDAAKLSAIRAGALSLEAVKSEAEGLIELVREAEKSSALPAEPDFYAVNQNVCSLVHGWIYGLRSRCRVATFERASLSEEFLRDDRGNAVWNTGRNVDPGR